MRRVKGTTSRKIQEEYPALRKRYWGKRFWGRDIFAPHQAMLQMK